MHTFVQGTSAEAPQKPFSNNILPTFRRCRALVLDSSYRPIDVVNWQRAICLDLFDKVSLWQEHVLDVGCIQSATAYALYCAQCALMCNVQDRAS
jgi:hypothetical protein